MTNKPPLSFYTNIPTPYQIAFFEELAKVFTLKVIFYSITEGNRTWEFAFNGPYEVIILKDNFIARFMQKWIVDFHFSLTIIRLLLRDKSNFVIVGGAYYTPNATFAMIISKIRGKKVAYFSEPLFTVKSKVKYFFKWLSLRVVNICCKALFGIGKKAAESFRTYQVNIPAFNIPYNINSKVFGDLNEDKLSAFRNKYKPNQEIIALSSGALINRKGMDILIKAIGEIKNPNLRLVIIGDGPDRKELENLSVGDSRIIFAGFQKPDDTPYFFAIADIFTFASRYDGWAVVINEAIAADVPVISSDAVGASVDLFTNRVNGIICESENISAFKEAIEFLANSKENRLKIGTAAKDLKPLIDSQYNAEKVYRIFTKELV